MSIGTGNRSSKSSTMHTAHSERLYQKFLDSLDAKFRFLVKKDDDGQYPPLFTTNVGDLFGLFLSKFPAGELRKHYTCNSCRRFVDVYGGIVTIDENGDTVPAIWSEANGLYEAPVEALRRAVSRARVTGVFLNPERKWGIPQTGDWNHMCVIPPEEMVFKHRVLTPYQAMAEKKEEYDMLCRGLIDFPVTTVEQALQLLESESLYRSEKCLGVAKWLYDLHRSISKMRGPRRDNLVWKAVATAPVGFCHVRSTMIGTLLEDIASGLSFEVVSKRFAEKMHPLQYRRPTAPPAEGNINAAEKLVEKLGIQRSLERRYATLEDLITEWTPPMLPLRIARSRAQSEVFSHLRGTVSPPPGGMNLPVRPITWTKFREEVLPQAEKIGWQVPYKGPFVALVTAVHEDAPPILQWDSEKKRNPVSWYVYNGGSHASQWGLNHGTWAEVTAITLLPHMWNRAVPLPNFDKGVVCILRGAMDTQHSGLALFPEILHSDLNPVRATIERFSKTGNLQGRHHGNACGVDLRQWGQVLRVKLLGKSGTIDYKIDRWD